MSGFSLRPLPRLGWLWDRSQKVEVVTLLYGNTLHSEGHTPLNNTVVPPDFVERRSGTIKYSFQSPFTNTLIALSYVVLIWVFSRRGEGVKGRGHVQVGPTVAPELTFQPSSLPPNFDRKDWTLRGTKLSFGPPKLLASVTSQTYRFFTNRSMFRDICLDTVRLTTLSSLWPSSEKGKEVGDEVF